MALVKSSRRPTRLAFPSFGPPTAFPSFEDFENRMNRFMQRAFTEPFGEQFGTAMSEPIGWVPAMDIVETAKELTVTAELPGIDQKDIDVSVEDGVLTIRGEKNDEREQEDKRVYLYERSYGSFQRAFTLPTNVDATKVAAEFAKGVLKVHLPKDGEAKPKGRKVEIKTT
jgi:HSP20 family protein